MGVYTKSCWAVTGIALNLGSSLRRADILTVGSHPVLGRFLITTFREGHLKTNQQKLTLTE
jgi:hypothetical protein